MKDAAKKRRQKPVCAIGEHEMKPTQNNMVKRPWLLALGLYVVCVAFLLILKFTTTLTEKATTTEIFAGPAITLASTFVIWIAVSAVLRRVSKNG